MKASALLFGCLVVAAPAQAVTHGGPHPSFGHHHRGHGFLSQTFLPGVFAPEAQPEPETPAPEVVFAPAPRCLLPEPVAAPARPSGPHIVYIGHRPEVSGPRVIYGTE